MTMNYDTNHHSVFSLNYHMIFVVKYRHKVIDDAICNRLKEIFVRIAGDKRYQLELDVLRNYVRTQGEKSV